MTDPKIDPARVAVYHEATGIPVRATYAGKLGTFDMGELDRESLFNFLRKNGGANLWAENMVLLLLDHEPLKHNPPVAEVVISDLVSLANTDNVAVHPALLGSTRRSQLERAITKLRDVLYETSEAHGMDVAISAGCSALAGMLNVLKEVDAIGGGVIAQSAIDCLTESVRTGKETFVTVQLKHKEPT